MYKKHISCGKNGKNGILFLIYRIWIKLNVKSVIDSLVL